MPLRSQPASIAAAQTATTSGTALVSGADLHEAFYGNDWFNVVAGYVVHAVSAGLGKSRKEPHPPSLSIGRLKYRETTKKIHSDDYRNTADAVVCYEYGWALSARYLSRE